MSKTAEATLSGSLEFLSRPESLRKVDGVKVYLPRLPVRLSKVTKDYYKSIFTINRLK
jgi:hypothetical protein